MGWVLFCLLSGSLNRQNSISTAYVTVAEINVSTQSSWVSRQEAIVRVVLKVAS